MNSCHFRDTIFLIDYATLDMNSSAVLDKEFWLISCSRGFHVYESTWTPTHHEILHCSCAEGNVYDPYAVKVMHLPKEISTAYFLLFGKGVQSHTKLLMRGDSVQLIWYREGSKHSACWLLAVRRETEWTSCRNYWLLALKK